MTQSGPCSRGGKSPGDSGVGFIAASHQGCQFAGEGSPIGYLREFFSSLLVVSPDDFAG